MHKLQNLLALTGLCPSAARVFIGFQQIEVREGGRKKTGYIHKGSQGYIWIVKHSEHQPGLLKNLLNSLYTRQSGVCGSLPST